MNVRADLWDLVRDIALSEHRAVGDSIQFVREKWAGEDAVFAVAFEDRDGGQRRGLLGMRRHDGDTWTSSGGFMGSTRATGQDDVWTTWGFWGPAGSASRTRAVAGGWVADPAATHARMADGTGRALTDEIESGVCIFMWQGDLDLRSARLELLDRDGHVTRRGPMLRSR
jgi:hypothetical protein